MSYCFSFIVCDAANKIISLPRSEKRRKALFSVSDEEVKPYLPLPAVLQGLFGLAQKLFGVTLSEAPASRGISGWHEDVTVYEVKSTETGEALAVCFLDPYARPSEKRGGAWMNSATPRSKALAPPGEERLLPVCYLGGSQRPFDRTLPSLPLFSPWVLLDGSHLVLGGYSTVMIVLR